MLRSTAALALLVVVSGCALTGRGLDPGPAGAESLGGQDATGKAFDYPLDLSELLIQAAGVDTTHPVANAARRAASAPSDGATVAAPLVSLEEARRYFYANCGTADECSAKRDQMQDRLVWASESACTDYLKRVRRSFTATNLNLGSATTLFGALGSVLTGTDATRVFSGAAAVTSGLRAEYNDTYFSSQAFDLVSKAIRNVRERGLKHLQDARTRGGIAEYNVDAAVADAVRYHATCNVMSGLEEAADAVARDRDPGLKRLSEVLQASGLGGNMSIGTAALSTAALPSAARSCEMLKQAVTDSAATVIAFDSALASAAAPVNDAGAKKKQADAIAAEIAALQKLSDADCKADGAVVTAERDMNESMRVFATLPLEQKPTGRAQFDAARAKVLALKTKLDSLLSKAQAQLGRLKVATKLS